MKPEETELFETFVATHPDFLGCNSWEPGPDPPDVIITDASGRKFGVELTEWLNKSQTAKSIKRVDEEFERLTALDTESHPQPKNFAYVQLRFRHGVRFAQKQREKFRQEFYELIGHVDETWAQEMGQEAQKLWMDFTNYPTLGKHVYLMRFDDQLRYRPPVGSRWALGTPRGGAYDPRDSSHALLDTIEAKRKKTNYEGLREQLGLTGFVLLIHYGIRGILHNTWFEGLYYKLEDVLREAREYLAADPGPFDRAYLYLAYNEGPLYVLYPDSVA